MVDTSYVDEQLEHVLAFVNLMLHRGSRCPSAGPHGSLAAADAEEPDSCSTSSWMRRLEALARATEEEEIGVPMVCPGCGLLYPACRIFDVECMMETDVLESRLAAADRAAWAAAEQAAAQQVASLQELESLLRADVAVRLDDNADVPLPAPPPDDSSAA